MIKEYKNNYNFPDKKYNIIYCDIAWKTNFINRKGLTKNEKNHLYKTMNKDEILNLPIPKIADNDCILFMWVINSEIPLALQCIKHWGFHYITVAFTWVKMLKNDFHVGLGNWTRSNPELCLLAKKGNIKRQGRSVNNLIISQLREHSRKPDEIRDRIVELVGDLPRIELFARQKTFGWDVWGDEVDKDFKNEKGNKDLFFDLI